MEEVQQSAAWPGPGCVRRFESGPVQIRADHILRIQGYTDPERVRRAIRNAATEAAGMAEQAAHGEVWYARRPVVACSDGVLELMGDVRFRCEAFDKFLGECSEVVVFALTVGKGFDERIQQLIDEDRPLESLLLDTAGWLGVEAVTRRFSQWLKPAAEGAGLKITRRMGPGYSYKLGEALAPWSLEEQQELFSLLECNELGIELLESCAMLPKMSRSGLYGLKPAG